jgi:hypothetical protein
MIIPLKEIIHHLPGSGKLQMGQGGGNLVREFLLADAASDQFTIELLPFFFGTSFFGSKQENSVRLDQKTQKRNPILCPIQDRVFQREVQLIRKITLSLLLPGYYFRFLISPKNTIIHVADIPFHLELFLHKVVEKREIEVCEVLAGQVPNRDPFPDQYGVTGDNLLQKIQYAMIFYDPAELFIQNTMIDGIEVFSHIKLQKPFAAAGILKCFLYRFLGTFAFAAGIGVMDEVLLEPWFKNPYHRMMQDPLLERSRTDHPFFRIMDREVMVVSDRGVA